MSDELLFKESLTEENEIKFKNVKKNEFHNHGILGSNKEIFKKAFPTYNLPEFKKCKNIDSLSLYIRDNLLTITSTSQGQLSLIKCTILTAISEGINTLDISVDYRSAINDDKKKQNAFLKGLQALKKAYSKNIIVNYDLGISRNKYSKQNYKQIIDLIDSKIFNGIDLYGDELSKRVCIFKKIYRRAEKNNMLLKAHVGEFGTAKDIVKAIKVLHLKMIQHGISIITSKKAMIFAKKKNVVFNVCPTSNYLLCRVNSYANHPIKKMYSFGLKVTINTDDQLLFNSSLFNEYLLLYKNQTLNIDELNKIRIYSLSVNL